MVPSSVVWHNCRLAWRVGAFSQLLIYFFKLLVWLMTLPQGGGAFLLFDGRFTVVLLERSFIGEESDTILVGFFLLDSPSVAQSVTSPHQSLQTWLRVEHRLMCCCNPLLITWFKKKKKIGTLSSLITRANIQIYRHAELSKKKEAGLGNLKMFLTSSAWSKSIGSNIS